jgi:hypothetical protein
MVALVILLGLAVTALVQGGTVVLIDHGVLDGGATVSFRLPWNWLGAGAAACLVLAVVSSDIPARHALRSRR